MWCLIVTDSPTVITVTVMCVTGDMVRFSALAMDGRSLQC